jgi:hypothetical protein
MTSADDVSSTKEMEKMKTSAVMSCITYDSMKSNESQIYAEEKSGYALIRRGVRSFYGCRVGKKVWHNRCSGISLSKV